MGKLFHTIKGFILDIGKTAPDYASINTRRLYYTSALAILLHIIFAVVFFGSVSFNELWKILFFSTNLAMLFIWIAVFLCFRFLRKRPCPGKMDYIAQYFIVVIFLLYGIVITVANLMLSNDILPFTISLLFVAVIFLFKPIFALIAYISSYALFFFAIGLFSSNASVLLINRLNGFVATSVSLLISLIMWRYNNINFMQKERIKHQQLELEKANRELETANKELEKMAYSDPLTGLPNRRHFDVIVNKEMRLIDRKKHESCLIMLDIDFFKNINDRYGHPVGDELLVQVGKLLKCHIRKSDSLCRLGGEEFIILLPRTDLSGAAVVAENLRRIIECTSFEAGADNVKMTASFGVAQLSFNGDESYVNNYAKADNALYLAKKSGRNCVIAA